MLNIDRYHATMGAASYKEAARLRSQALSEAEATLVQARFSSWLALSQVETLLGRRVFPTSGDRTNR